MVLAAGGYYFAQFVTESAELYDPASGSWTATSSLSAARTQHTATLLPNDRVLVAGGSDSSGNALASAELYDPASGSWTATGNLNTARYGFTATLLPNDKVLVAGGVVNSGPPFFTASAELYDPATGSWTATGDLNTGRTQHTATLLLNGKVLLQGELIATATIRRARNCMIRRAGAGLSPAISTPHAMGIRRRCCPTARYCYRRIR